MSTPLTMHQLQVLATNLLNAFNSNTGQVVITISDFARDEKGQDLVLEFGMSTKEDLTKEILQLMCEHCINAVHSTAAVVEN